MKKILFLSLVLASQIAFAQSIKVLSNEEIPLSSSEGYFNPVLSPDGNFMLVTSSDTQGLLKYDFATKKLTPITSNAGAGFDAQISSDGNVVVYRTQEYKNQLRYTSLIGLNLKTGKKTVLIKPTRDLEGVTIKDGTVLAVNNGKLTTKKLSGKKLSATPPVISVKQGQYYLTQGKSTRLIAPLGEDLRYLWISVSPDGTKLLYGVIEHGKAYVSNLDGSNPVSLGTLNAPKWMGNDWVVGMLDSDDGHVITASKIIAVTAAGTVREDLTDKSIIATSPVSSADGSKILYNTDDGKVYLMHVKISK